MSCFWKKLCYDLPQVNIEWAQWIIPNHATLLTGAEGPLWPSMAWAIPSWGPIHGTTTTTSSRPACPQPAPALLASSTRRSLQAGRRPPLPRRPPPPGPAPPAAALNAAAREIRSCCPHRLGYQAALVSLIYLILLRTECPIRSPLPDSSADPFSFVARDSPILHRLGGDVLGPSIPLVSWCHLSTCGQGCRGCGLRQFLPLVWPGVSSHNIPVLIWTSARTGADSIRLAADSLYSHHSF